MSDRVFSGRDVAEALASAAQALGVAAEKLRYVVLDAGSPGGLGLKPTPARVAVLLAGRAAASAPRPRTLEALPRGSEGEGRATPPEAGDPALEIGKVVATLAQAAGAELEAAVSATAEALEVRIQGKDVAPFLLGEGEPRVLDALDHILHGMFARRIAPLRLRVECEGRREHREQRLKAHAQALAADVLRDGQPRTTEPLNSFERRLVHMAVADLGGLVTYSVGGGPDRRVTIAPEKAPLGGEVH